MQAQPAPRLHLPSLLQFALSGLALAGALTASAALALAGLMALGQRDTGQAASVFTLAGVVLLVGLLAAPGGALALLRLMGRPAPRWAPRFSTARAANWALAGWAVLVLAALGLERVPGLTWLLAPPLILPAIAVPIAWVFETGRRGLPVMEPERAGSAQRAWGLLSLGLVVTPAVVMVVELLVMIAAVAAVMVWLQARPGLAPDLSGLIDRLRSSADPERALETLLPILRLPVTLATGLGLGAVALPLVEELLKPLPLLLFARRLSPAEGFTGGLICGAAFALVESLGFSANAAAGGVTAVALARVGAGLLHSVCTALAGWGLVTVFRGGRSGGRLAGWVRGLLALVLAVSLHGLWNLFGLLLGLSSLPGGLDGLPAAVQRLGQAAPLGLGVLAAALLAILLGGNRLLAADIKLNKEIYESH